MNPLGALLEPSWTLLDALTALLEPKTFQLECNTTRVKPEHVVGPESTVVIICLH